MDQFFILLHSSINPLFLVDMERPLPPYTHSHARLCGPDQVVIYNISSHSPDLFRLAGVCCGLRGRCDEHHDHIPHQQDHVQVPTPAPLYFACSGVLRISGAFRIFFGGFLNFFIVFFLPNYALLPASSERGILTHVKKISFTMAT